MQSIFYYARWWRRDPGFMEDSMNLADWASRNGRPRAAKLAEKIRRARRFID